jgi:hypothetical protein
MHTPIVYSGIVASKKQSSLLTTVILNHQKGFKTFLNGGVEAATACKRQQKDFETF